LNELQRVARTRGETLSSRKREPQTSKGVKSALRLLAGAERSSTLQRIALAPALPTHRRHFAPGELPFLTDSTYHRAKLFESDRFA